MNPVNLATPDTKPNRYERCIEASKRVRWDIEADVIRGRSFDRADKYLPDGLSLTPLFTTLSDDEKRFVSQIQGRTYANVFGLAERFVNAKVLEVSRDHWFGDQTALEALVRFCDEELKHQALFRRIEGLIEDVLPPGYRFDFDPDEVARRILDKSTWAVLALTLDIELFTQLHYRQSIEPDDALSELYRDVFLYHWKEESQHAILDELEWVRHDATLTQAERDRAVDEFIELVTLFDEILQAQAKADADYFVTTCGRSINEAEARACRPADVLHDLFGGLFRWPGFLSHLRSSMATMTQKSSGIQLPQSVSQALTAGILSSRFSSVRSVTASLSAAASARSSFTSGLVAWRAVSPARRRLPASRIPLTRSNTSSPQCPCGGTVRRRCPHRADPRAQS
jgi:hypothetical protein